MLHSTGNYNKTASLESSSGRGSPRPTVQGQGFSLSSGNNLSEKPLRLADQIMSVKASLVNIIHDKLMDKVPDETIQCLLKLTEQLESAAAMREQRISIAVPSLQAPAAAASKFLESPTTQPTSAHSRVRSLDLNDIPTYKVDSYHNGNNPTSGDVSPVSTVLTKRKSVVFFQPPDQEFGSIHLGSNQSPNADDEGHRFVARSYSGFGSFRRASRHASMAGGDLAQQRALSFHANGMPAFDLGGDLDGGMRNRFSRPIARHTEVFAEDSTAFTDACTAAGVLLLDIDVDNANTDLLAVEAEEADVIKTVACNVFSQYNCMRPGVIDVGTFIQFVDAVSRYNNVTNPYRNGLHTADTLLSVHQYLRQPAVANNFTDGEITTMLIAALCVNLGYLGVSNEFLLQLNHPLSRIFSIINTSESVATMIGLHLLGQYNFLSSSCDANDVFWLGIKEGIADLVISAGAREHQSQLRQVLGVAERGFVSDSEVPLLMSCVLRAATMRFCCKPTDQHIRHAELWVNEAYKQSECERILKFTDSPQWTNDTAWSSLQSFVTIVAVPYFDALQEFFPEEWYQNMLSVMALYGSFDSPIANDTASFRGGAAPLSIAIDTNVPEWSDQSTAAMNILISAIPQHLLLGTPVGRVGTAARNRMDHYYSFLQLYDACERDVLRSESFGGNLVQLAMRLDPLYIGEYASALIDEEDFNTYADAAALIIRTEATPDTSTVMSPGRRSVQSTDAFIVLLLRMMQERSGAAPLSANDSRDETDNRRSSTDFKQMSPVAPGGGRDMGGSGSVSAMSMSSEQRRPTSGLAGGGPFRGKWRLHNLGGNSVYDGPRKK